MTTYLDPHLDLCLTREVSMATHPRVSRNPLPSADLTRITDTPLLAPDALIRPLVEDMVRRGLKNKAIVDELYDSGVFDTEKYSFGCVLEHPEVYAYQATSNRLLVWPF